LPALAGATAANGQALRAASLAAAEKRLEAVMGRPPSSIYTRIHEHLLEAARAECDETEWAAAWEAGEEKSLEEAIEYAISP
jgi:hypothetical protein